MNQILITKKLYITPELRRKKKIYKFYLIISIFVISMLTSFYIYAEYDKNKSEETSHILLSEVSEVISSNEQENKIAERNNDDILRVVLDASDDSYYKKESDSIKNISIINANAEVRTTMSGYKYRIIARIDIPKINITYPVLQGEKQDLDEIEELLKISPCKYEGNEPNEVGNFCVVGHNYRNKKFFSKVPTLVVGDVIKITDLTGRTLEYEVYESHNVDPSDTSDTTSITGGKKEVTLITCTDDSKERVIVKAKEIRNK